MIHGISGISSSECCMLYLQDYGEVGSRQMKCVSRVVKHELYNSPSSTNNDIALLRLLTPFTWTDQVVRQCSIFK